MTEQELTTNEALDAMAAVEAAQTVADLGVKPLTPRPPWYGIPQAWKAYAERQRREAT